MEDNKKYGAVEPIEQREQSKIHFDSVESRERKASGQCGDCNTCGKCDDMIENDAFDAAVRVAASANHNSFEKDLTRRLKDTQSKTVSHDGMTLYTLIIYSENFAGILNQITAVFTRRQVNIESLNVCASSTPGVHKYTITCFCKSDMAQMLVKQIEKKIDVLQANCFVDDEIFILETSLLKLSTPMVLANQEIGRIVRRHGARIVEVNPTYAIVEKTGITDEVLSLFEKLNELNCVLQFVRTGRIAVTKSNIERLDQYIAQREEEQNG